MSSGTASLEPWQQMLAGGIAGGVETLFMQPLDLVKTRFMLAPKKYGGIAGAAREIVRAEGFGAFYRGLPMPLLCALPWRAVKFTAYEQYRRLLGSTDVWASLVSGALAGATESLVLTPFETVKIRMQADRMSGSARFANSWDATQQIVRGGGVAGLYSGLVPTAVRQALFTTAYFLTYARAKDGLPATAPENAVWKYEPMRHLAAGFAAGVVGTMCNTPADVIKTRIQNGSSRGFFQTLSSVVRADGILALYSGFVPKVLRLGPGSAIIFGVVEQVSAVMSSWNEQQRR